MGPTGSKLGSWVYLFSKFTPEALLFEAFVILGLLACYLAFWVLKKRRMGSVENVVPAGLVKVYLNQLIGEAEILRTQLFGLLNGVSPVAGQQAALRAMSPDLLSSISAQLPAAGAQAGGMTGADKGQLSALEAKMSEQAKAMEAIVIEKTRIEKELAAAKAAGAKAGAAPADDGMIAKLQERIRVLEGKLAEYSVIEDDLANLKRLQQENSQLRAALEKGGGSVPAPAAPAAEAPKAAAPAVAEAPAPAAAAPAPTPAAQAPAPAPAAQAPAPAAPKPEPVAAAVAAAPPAETTGDENFENLVDEVEKSLQEEPAAAAPAPAAPASAGPSLEAAAPTGGAAPAQEKTDADLVAEFEKMLKG